MLDVIERYDAFVLAEAAPATARKIAREHLVEDITDQYQIPVGAGTIDTSIARIDAEGVTRAHPTYRRAASLPAGPHHYLVQFAGPIKDEWLRGVKRAGGEPRQLWGNFVFVVRADDAAIAKIAALPLRALDGASPKKAERKKQIKGLATVHGVRKIRQRAVKRPSNNVAAGLMHTAASMGSPGFGLSGKGQTIGVCDTGLDTGDPASIHPDFAGRVASIKSYPMTSDLAPYVTNPGGDDGPADLDSGHGTHTSGSVLGSGASSAAIPGLSAPIRGLAYGAKLVFQAVEQECKWKNPADIKQYGRYLLVGIPADLKSLFSDAYTYGQWWPRDFPVAPFKADPMADDPNKIVPFSSRGPTKDKRFSPDVVAPGTFVLSTRSIMIAPNNTAWAAFPASKLYFFMGGTSMATPLVSGAVAVLREYLRKKKQISKPSAALCKAAWIDGATRLAGYGPAGAVVDNHQGYGRVNLDGVIAPQASASSRFTEVRPGLKTGGLSSSKLKVKSNGRPLRIALAWSDPPGPTLVNNLNLIVTAPDGRKYVGNQRQGGPPTLDGNNNAELVHIKKPAAGVWRVDVVGSNIARGPQDFALVSIGHF